MFNFGSTVRASDGNPIRHVRRLGALVFSIIQLVLVARILLDLGVIPGDLSVSETLVAVSDALAAPVRDLGEGLGGILGGGGLPGFGSASSGGLNPAMVAALIGWTVVEGLVLRVIGKFASI